MTTNFSSDKSSWWALFIVCSLGLGCFTSQLAAAETREQKVRNDKLKFESNGLWLYNDLEKGFEIAKKSNQPLIVVLRCVPCEECVKLDDELLENDPQLQRLLNSFVRVRIVGTNGLDLSLFEFDTDQSFCVFFFNADRTLYGRYGTRSDRTEWKNDVSVAGLGKTMEAVLRIHQQYPKNRDSLVPKQASKPKYATPESIPSLAKRFTNKLDYEGNVVKSCIHCHMIGESIREDILASTGKIPEKMLFPFPHPKIIGLIPDPTECSTIREVTPDSVAFNASLKPGDQIKSMNGQKIVSIADMQWVLHNLPNEKTQVDVEFTRDEKTQLLTIRLPEGWKAQENISWRASTWALRRIGLGGMSLKPTSKEERDALGIPDNKMAIRVQHVGAYEPHNIAMKAGVIKDDVIVSFNDRDDILRETDLLNYAINQIGANSTVKLKIVRGNDTKILDLPVNRK